MHIEQDTVYRNYTLSYQRSSITLQLLHLLFR